jgi:hypothetical protein
VRSTGHRVEASVMSLVSYKSVVLPTALWLSVSTFVLVTHQKRDELRDYEGGLE